MTTHDDDIPPDDDHEAPLEEMMAEAIADLNPYTPDAITVRIPSFALHMELCRGHVHLQFNHKVAKQLLDQLTMDLSAPPPGAKLN